MQQKYLYSDESKNDLICRDLDQNANVMIQIIVHESWIIFEAKIQSVDHFPLYHAYSLYQAKPRAAIATSELFIQ